MSRRSPRDESGASLVIALIFVTVVATVVAALLSFADSSIRTTIALREQGSVVYAADGAAQVAINAIRDSTFTYESGACFGAEKSLSLPAFPGTATQSDTATQSAVVTCTPQRQVAPRPPVGAYNVHNTPANAILTLGTSDAEPGIGLASTKAGNVLAVDADVVSNSTISADAVALTSTTDVSAATSCSGVIKAPTKTCGAKAPAAVDPDYPAPKAAAVLQRMPTCPKAGGLVTLTPGLYTSSAALSACDRANITMWFTPGTYYFSFPSSSSTWEMDNATVVGGTPTQSLATQVPSMPGSCVSPLATTTPDAGVQFVFGGDSRVVLGPQAQVELCGSYSVSAPPVAVYGLDRAVDAVPAENGCITAVKGCPLISATSNGQGKSALYVQGTVYAPRASLALSSVALAQRDIAMAVNAGVVVRSLSVLLDGPGSRVVGLPALSAPPPPVRLPESLVWMQVFVCSDVSPCNPKVGRLLLRARVGFSEPTSGDVVAGARSVQIYSWAVQR